ncbi:MAG: peptidoglycan DD-metalloendopeptidase family protein [Patescibacteria group bacterium]
MKFKDLKRRFLFVLMAVVLLTTVAPAVYAQSNLLTEKSKELQELNKKIEQQQKVLDATRKRKASLKSEIDLLEQQIELSQLQLQAINTQIDKTRLDMNRINGDLVDAEVEIYENKKVLREAIKEVYKRKQVGVLEVLVGSTNLSEFMSQIEYISTIEGRITNSISVLQDLNASLKDKKGELETADRELKQLQASEQLEQNSLNVQQSSRENLLNDATLTESEYQKRIQESVLEQQKLENEIAQLAKNSPKVDLPPPGKLLWPIPSRLVTAGFREPGYRARFGINHNAIDIATPHGTPIKAPADGYVLKVKFDGSTAYSYIMVNHGGGLVTVYGHVSSVNVSVGQFVPAGAVIGGSGATPGSVGAGRLTTGPHLHFEVWLNGAAQNPFNYLVG